MNKPHHLTNVALADIRREEDESLFKFMERYSSISVQTQNLSPKVTLTSMIIALNFDPFSDSLCKKLLATLHELRARAIRFI